MPAPARPQIAASAPRRSNFGAARIALWTAVVGGLWAVGAQPRVRALAASAARPLAEALDPSAPALKFGEVAARRANVDGRTILYIEGALHNSGAAAAKSPSLRIALIGDDGRPLYAWKAKPVAPEIRAGADAPFQTRLLSPPESFARIEVTVAEGR